MIGFKLKTFSALFGISLVAQWIHLVQAQPTSSTSSNSSTIVAQDDPLRKNLNCPCFNRQNVRIILSTQYTFGNGEMLAFSAGAKRAAADAGVSLDSFDRSNQPDGLSNVFLGLINEGYHGSIISNIPIKGTPSNSAFQLALNSFPNISVVSVISGEDQVVSMGRRLLSYIGPNNTMSGYQAIQSLRNTSAITTRALVLCVNPSKGLDAGTDAVCAGARAGTDEIQGTLEEFIDLDPSRLTDAKSALVTRLNSGTTVNAIIAPSEKLVTLLVGQAGDELYNLLRTKSIPVVAVGPSMTALAGMGANIIHTIIDHQEYMQGYLAVTLSHLFQMGSIKVDNTHLWTGPVVYQSASLKAQNLMSGFNAYVNARDAGFPDGAFPVNRTSAFFTVASHARRASGFWTNWRSGIYRGEVDSGVSTIEMVTEVTDGVGAASFIANVTNNNDPVKSAGWIVSLSRQALFVPVLIPARDKKIPIVGVNSGSGFANVQGNFSDMLAFIGNDEGVAGANLAQQLLKENPLATQALCTDTDAPTLGESVRCSGFLGVLSGTGVNATYLGVLSSNSIAAAQKISSVVSFFPKSTRWIVQESGSTCWILGVFQSLGIPTGQGTNVAMGSFDSSTCVVEAMINHQQQYTVLQQEYAQGYLPIALQTIYLQTGQYPFGNRLVIPNRNASKYPFPFVMTGTLMTPDALDFRYVNCTTSSVSATVVTGPTDLRNFPFGDIVWPVCDLKVVPPTTGVIFTTPWSSGSGGAVLGIVLFVGLAIVAGMVIIAVKGAHPVVKAMSPVFVYFILAGMLGLDLVALIDIGEPTEWKCAVETFIVPCSYGIVVGCILVKNYRVYRIFANSTRVKMAIPNTELLIGVGALVLPNLILAIAWTAAAPKRPQLAFITNSIDQFYVCASDRPQVDSIILGLFYAFNAVLLLIAAAVAFLTRNVRDLFSETTQIGYSVYNAVVTIAVLVPLLMASVIADYNVKFWFKVVLLVYPNAFGFGMLFGKRLFFDAWRDPVETNSTSDSGSHSHSTGIGMAVRTNFGGMTTMGNRAAKAKAEMNKGFGKTNNVISVLFKKGLLAAWQSKVGVFYDDHLILLFDANSSTLNTGTVINLRYWKLGYTRADTSRKLFTIGLYQPNANGGNSITNSAGANSMLSSTPNAVTMSSNQMSNTADMVGEQGCSLLIDFRKEDEYAKWVELLRPDKGPLGRKVAAEKAPDKEQGA